MVRLSQLPCGLAITLAMGQGVSATPVVNIGMKAAFPAGPYLLELLETAAAENSSAYFPMLDRISMGIFSSAVTEAQMYTSFISVLHADRHITDHEALSTFNWALSLRTASPRIEAHYQYYESSVEPIAGDVEDCLNWVLLDGNRYCSPDLLKPANIGGQLPRDITDVPFERSLGSGKKAILYADPTSPSFGPFHRALSAAAEKGELNYRLRYRRSPGSTLSALPVSGYAVELSLKRTDYIVIDDREAEQDASQKSGSTDVDLDDEEEVADLRPLSTSELESLGLKAASFVMQHDYPLEALVKLTQDLPKFTTSVANHEISEDFLGEHQKNRGKMIPPGINNLWINGVKLIERQIDPFSLVDMVRRERTFLQGVRDLGFSGKQALSLLGHNHVAAAKSNAVSPRYDWTDRPEEGSVIIWLNDLENDAQYAEFPSSLNALLQRMYPGQLPPIRRNIFNLVFPVDLSDPDDLAALSQTMALVTRKIPIRFGFVPLVSNPKASTQAKIAYHLTQDYGFRALIDYLGELQESSTDASEKLLAATVEEHTLKPNASKKSWSTVMGSDHYLHQVDLAQQWARRLGAGTSNRIVFVDGTVLPRDKTWMQSVSMKITEDLQLVQKAIFKSQIDEDTWVPGIFLEQASSSRNVYITPENEKALKVLNVNKIYSDFSGLFDAVPVLQGSAESAKETWAILTVIADLESSSGRELLLEALKFKHNRPGVRLDIIPNPQSSGSAFGLNTALRSNLQKLQDLSTLAELDSILEAKPDSHDNNPGFRASLDNFLSSNNLAHGSQVLLLNGRVVGPIPPDEAFKEASFQELFKFEYVNRIKPVYEALEALGLSQKITDPTSAAKVTSLTALSTISDLPDGIFESTSTLRTSVYDDWESKYTAIETGDPESSSVHIVGLLNPLSEQGQRWAPIIKVLSELKGVYVKLFLNPKENIAELPVKRFFRYILQSAPSFNEDGSLKTPNATFKGLPSEALLTAAMHVPPAWLVAPKVSVHDLDNIKLSTVKGDVEAVYELEHILIEGHSRQTTGPSPRGAQLVLGTDAEPFLTDTIIMANLGYFQFKANPGYYNIRLKEGRSSEIYTIDSIGARSWEAVPGDEGTYVSVMDFQGTTLYPRLKRQRGMDDVDVLEDSDGSEDGIISAGLKFAGSLFGKKRSASDKEHAEINIFSVASGHLYERMLNIMMVSVMRNTKHTVKFWFIEQFLSPSFKEFIPHMAKEYGFRYEMVTFKWPHWLRHQREKQREIWGYKILFLDVLFPLSLDKVIFVDADQIVRTDMIDLVNHDLEGAPYGFVPMGDSRTEMEGFRFWKQGYWANFLRGQPYHISALYVVDLGRFRKLAAGDILRQQYHSLSADPNSLSNLDQDLPNNMMFRIPIHTLPQEWLWCETWCSDEDLATARTIDLCNNPLTKEPKLDRARRQVPEWTVYDDEIAALAKRIRETVGSEVAAHVHDVHTMSRRLDEHKDQQEGVHTKDEL
ncbi:hypothetical protein GMORB2_2023 [Geosmithia morbida]|uniref:UDP-glucose:glycoprotein glucosyltransferase n=1 Tax=Geosmithia morbida TaxID=1094350 RepID=A0A9P4YT81_9HYPO|nr:uncharacterized protein GMORB2_2023 [Geosmithia morbida]KAF4121615.1 hypothetical protein GMORB2_2023 [Geosmithia morbida]